MPKVNVLNQPRYERKRLTKTYEQDGEPITLSLIEPNGPRMARAGQKVAEMVEQFIEGSDEEPAVMFPDPDVEPSEHLFWSACVLEEMQTETDVRERYEAWEFCVIAARRPHDWQAILADANAIGRSWVAEPGKSPAAPAASSSAPRCD